MAIFSVFLSHIWTLLHHRCTHSCSTHLIHLQCEQTGNSVWDQQSTWLQGCFQNSTWNDRQKYLCNLVLCHTGKFLECIFHPLSNLTHFCIGTHLPGRNWHSASHQSDPDSQKFHHKPGGLKHKILFLKNKLKMCSTGVKNKDKFLLGSLGKIIWRQIFAEDYSAIDHQALAFIADDGSFLAGKGSLSGTAVVAVQFIASVRAVRQFITNMVVPDALVPVQFVHPVYTLEFIVSACHGTVGFVTVVAACKLPITPEKVILHRLDPDNFFLLPYSNKRNL